MKINSGLFLPSQLSQLVLSRLGGKRLDRTVGEQNVLQRRFGLTPVWGVTLLSNPSFGGHVAPQVVA